MATTNLAQLINPEVLAPMISAKIEKKVIVSKVAKVDNTLVGQPGNEVSVPQFKYIGDAEDVAEGVACGTARLETGATSFSIKKAMKGVSITDEAILSGYGDPVGESEKQLATAIANKIDNDVVEILTTPTKVDNDGKVQLLYNGLSGKIGYSGIVDALDLFEEEVDTEKVMYIHPAQKTTLRKDSDFLSADKYKDGVMLNGEIGMIAGTRIVCSKKVPLVEAKGDVVAHYLNPIVKLTNDAETEEDAPAVTIYLKRDTQVEKERHADSGTTDLFANKHYGVALTNTSKVVLASFKK